MSGLLDLLKFIVSLFDYLLRLDENNRHIYLYYQLWMIHSMTWLLGEWVTELLSDKLIRGRKGFPQSLSFYFLGNSFTKWTIFGKFKAVIYYYTMTMLINSVYIYLFLCFLNSIKSYKKFTYSKGWQKGEVTTTHSLN